MDRAAKEKFVADMNQAFNEAALVVIAHQSGLSASESADLRQKMNTGGARFKVTKNRLAKIAIKGTQYEGLEEHFTGPTAIAYSDDPIAAAKSVVEFANENDKVTVIAGGMGDKMLAAEEVKQLAKLPSLDELRATLIGLLQAPAGKIARTLNEPPAQLARVMAAKGQQGDAS